MRYDDPRLRELLAGEYVLGVMPRLARARFERLLVSDPARAREVDAWTRRFVPIDTTADAMIPPPAVWEAIEREIGTDPRRGAAPAPASNILNSLGFWRGFAGVATALAAGLLLFAILRPTPAPEVVAVLTDSAGTPAFVATRGAEADQIDVAPVRTQALAAQKSFELWAIAGGPPKPLGLVPAARGNRLQVPTSAIGSSGEIVLAISLEPENGSPQAGPTGPVLFQGKVLSTLR